MMVSEKQVQNVLEVGEMCECGGEIDRRCVPSTEPEMWQGVCFQCGQRVVVINSVEPPC